MCRYRAAFLIVCCGEPWIGCRRPLRLLDPYVIVVIIASAALGLFVGAVPGLTAAMAIALLVPVTFFMPPVPALAAMVTTSATEFLQATFREPCCEYRARRPRPRTPTRPTP